MQALDAPLGPGNLFRRPGACYPALRRLPGRDSHPPARYSLQTPDRSYFERLRQDTPWPQHSARHALV